MPNSLYMGRQAKLEPCLELSDILALMRMTLVEQTANYASLNCQEEGRETFEESKTNFESNFKNYNGVIKPNVCPQHQ